MNLLDATLVRLGIYIGQLENQAQELHRQLLEKTKEFDQYRTASEARIRELEPKPAAPETTA